MAEDHITEEQKIQIFLDACAKSQHGFDANFPLQSQPDMATLFSSYPGLDTFFQSPS